MPLDTRIALGVQPLQLENPLASYGQAVGIQNAMQQNQLAQMQMSAAQRAAQEEEGAKNFLSSNPDLSTPENQRRLLAFGKTGLAYGKAIAEQQKSKGEADKTAAEVLGLNQKNFTALNPPIRAAAGGIPGITAYVESMYADPVLGKLAARIKTKEQALQENIDMFTKDPDQWITAHSNLEGAQMLDALKMSQERTDEKARIASRMPPAAAPVAPPAAVAPAAAAAPEAGITKEISPGVRVNSNLSEKDIARVMALSTTGKMDFPGERWTVSPAGNLISEPIPDATATNNLAPPVANVNAMNPNAATMQAINVERTRLEADRNRLLNLRQSKGVQDELKSVEAQLKEINAPVNLRAEGTAFIPGRGMLTAAPTMTEAQKEYAIIADPNASKGAKDAATARIAHLTNIPAKDVPALIQEYEYAQKNNGYKGSLADFKTIGPAVSPAPAFIAVQDPKDATKTIYVPGPTVGGLTPAAAAEKPLTAMQTQKLKAEKAADTAHVNASQSTADELERLTTQLVGSEDKKIKPHPGLGGITGYAALLPNLPKGSAAQAQQKLDTFKGKILALGREMASQNGKLGNMAVQEWKFVSDAVQALDPKAGNLDVQMRDVVRQAQAFAKNQKSKFDMTYEDTGAVAPAAGSGVDTNNPLLK
jgi:uncharacterized membrane protein